MDTFFIKIPIPDFPSLSIIQIDLDSPYYPLSCIANTLGYSTPYSLIQNIPPELKVSVSELYSLYTLYLGQFMSYCLMEYPLFKKCLGQFKPLWFTSIEGISWILAKNTFTIPRLKECIAQALGLTVIAPPRKESIFYSTLQSLLNQHSILLQRHLYLSGYFADCVLEIEDKKIVIEYDENKHKYYPKDKEMERENALRQLGYIILRVDDSIPPEQSALKVYLSIYLC